MKNILINYCLAKESSESSLLYGVVSTGFFNEDAMTLKRSPKLRRSIESKRFLIRWSVELILDAVDASSFLEPLITRAETIYPESKALDSVKIETLSKKKYDLLNMTIL